MDHSLQWHQRYIGRSATDLPTPSLVLSRPVMERNVKQLHATVTRLGIDFRPHVKTLKTIEAARMMLGKGKYRKVVTSTLAEVRGLLPLVEEGLLDECLYALPIRPGALEELTDLRDSLKIVLMIDNEQHIGILEDYHTTSSALNPWPVFIKVNIGSDRAGAPIGSSRLNSLTKAAASSPAIDVVGFYCHAGHSYSCQTYEEAASVLLRDELGGTLEAVKLLPKGHHEVIISIGSTPTAHVAHTLRCSLPPNVKLELHAGNFITNDLQQLSTSLIPSHKIGIRILAEISSTYPERNEALLNAGVLALSRETSAIDGFGVVVENPRWRVVRLSQEHGILAATTGSSKENAIGAVKRGEKVDETFAVGDKVFLYPQHACITAAAFFVHFVVDENDVVTEAWVPWKGW